MNSIFMKENIKIKILKEISQLKEIEIIESENFRNTAFRLKVLRELFNDERVIILVGMLDNYIKGYIILYNNEDVFDILKIAVKEEFKRKSIATRLLNYIRDNLIIDKEVKIMLEVRKTNDRAIKFYEKYGFQKISVRKKYYEDTNEDAIVMMYKK